MMANHLRRSEKVLLLSVLMWESTRKQTRLPARKIVLFYQKEREQYDELPVCLKVRTVYMLLVSGTKDIEAQSVKKGEA